MTEGRRLFGPTVLVGAGGSGLAALAGSKPWAKPDAGLTLVDTSGGHVPLAGALGLVALACWGVVLVTRSRVRRTVAVLGLLVGGALLVTTVAGRSTALDSARNAALDLRASGTAAHVTGWWWTALVSATLALAAFAIAVRSAGSWPEMGSRYDAPVTRPGPSDEALPPAELDDVDLWRAIDEGRDPTDPAGH